MAVRTGTGVKGRYTRATQEPQRPHVVDHDVAILGRDGTETPVKHHEAMEGNPVFLLILIPEIEGMRVV